MPYKNIVYAKLEKRLLNDHRWYMMSEYSQLNYIRFILLAQESYNKIPRSHEAIKLAFKTKQTVKTIKKSIEEIQQNFPKFKETPDFYYFEEFHEKTNYIKEGTPEELPRNSRGLPKEGTEKEKEKEKEKEYIKKVGFLKPTIQEVSTYIKEKGYSINPEQFWNHYEANGWMRGKAKIKSWHACVATWVKPNEPSKPKRVETYKPPDEKLRYNVPPSKEFKQLVNKIVDSK